MRDLLLLGIETTCDETAAAVVRRRADGTGAILSNIVHSQTEDHAEYGGVVPEIAARAHVEVLDHLVARALRAAGLRLDEIDGIAAAAGPGLIGGVIVGLTTAKALALAANKPLVAVNHLEAHALTARLTDKVPFPFLLLLVSGGHTQLVAVTGIGEYEKLGGTMDDAIGEAFDKAAKMLGLPYPGGPAVERAALQGDPERFALPRPLHGKPVPDFSLSGLKTAVRIEALKIAPLSEQDVNDLCASFQAAVVDILADRVRCALRLMRHQGLKPSALVLAGGVGANQSVRRALHKVAADGGTRLAVPPPELCTDNGAMIAWAGAERLARGLHDGLDASPRARWPLGEIEGVGAARAAAQAAETAADAPAAPPAAAPPAPSEGIGG
jgi:N6-L-threonylcarbamoyladenine synthase